jgi:hypothetical protein
VQEIAWLVRRFAGFKLSDLPDLILPAITPRKEIVMEDRLWSTIVSALPDDKVKSGQMYSDRLIMLVVLWAAIHDRPICWACELANWRISRLPAWLPHPSTISRRSRQPDFSRAIEMTIARLCDKLGSPSQEAMIDGVHLAISNYSRDPDAANVRAYRGFSQGYKLHAVIDVRGVVLAYEVRSLNVNERLPAGTLLTRLPHGVRRVLADRNYDSSKLHARLQPFGIRLYCPPFKGKISPRSHPRRRILTRLSRHPMGARIGNRREHIERQFGLMGNYGCGLKGLPHWVRRQHRVKPWLDAKLLIHHAFLISKHIPI